MGAREDTAGLLEYWVPDNAGSGEDQRAGGEDA